MRTKGVVESLAGHGVVAATGIGLWATTSPQIAVSCTSAVVALIAIIQFRRRTHGEARSREMAVESIRDQLSTRLEGSERDRSLRDQILAAMEEVVIVLERDRVTYANPAAVRTLNARLGGPPPPQITTRTDRVGRFTLHHPSFRIFRSAAFALPDGRTMIVAQDITAADQGERARRDFVANASHELKTPLAGVIATAETLVDAIDHDPPAARGFTADLLSEARRLSRLVQDLLDLTRLEATPEGPPPTTDWSDLVDRVAAEAKRAADIKDIRLSTSITPGLIVSARADDLVLLTRNLLDNALAYTPHGGAVSVHLGAEQGQAKLRIVDTGIGIPAKDLPRIFERFYRVDRARSRETGGTGLGLSIVRHVAQTYGGEVHADSRLKEGSTFIVRIPLPD